MRHKIIDNDDGLLEIEMVDDMPFLHLKIHKWSKSKYVEYLAIMQDLRNRLSDKGFKYVFANIRKGDKKLYKFLLMFGFLTVAETETTYIMAQES